MDSKQTIAIAVVAVLIIAGVGVGIFFATKDNSGNTVDKVKETVEVGDFYNERRTTYNESEVTKEDFLKNTYYDGDVKSTGEKDFVFHGKQYTCKKYVESSSTIGTITTYANDWNFIFEKVMENKEFSYKYTYTLKETSLNVEKSIDEQDVVDGATFTRQTTTELEETMTPGEDVYTYHIKDGKTIIDVAESLFYKVEVLQVKGDTVKIRSKEFGDGEISITEFRSAVSMDDWKINQEKLGYTDFQIVEKKDKVIETEFGKRHVTVETIKMVSPYLQKTVTYDLTYGDEGFLYSNFSHSLSETLTTVTDTSMIA